MSKYDLILIVRHTKLNPDHMEINGKNIFSAVLTLQALAKKVDYVNFLFHVTQIKMAFWTKLILCACALNSTWLTWLERLFMHSAPVCVALYCRHISTIIIVNFIILDVKGVISFDDFLRVRRHFMGAGSMSTTSAACLVGCDFGSGSSHEDKTRVDQGGGASSKTASSCDDDNQQKMHTNIGGMSIGSQSLSLQHSRQKCQARVAVHAAPTGGLDSSASDTSLVNSGELIGKILF